MQIKWLRKALQNINDEAEYIARDDPQAAQRVVQRIQQTVSLLSNNPSLGHLGRLPGTRELIIPRTRYVVPYRVRPRLQRIEILRVFHTSRRQPEGW
ncbi:type II toxin-antitoxin system RelE/ParE family toxin [Cardiobacterium sp. AH-315-I02]|nr:type II toxin-antitoxin system RelE/ParE family toxin [Cardiobacterium sp. AH-315-I02]